MQFHCIFHKNINLSLKAVPKREGVTQVSDEGNIEIKVKNSFQFT